MIGYIGLLYGFLLDTLYMKESFTWFELVGVLVILAMNILVICAKQSSKKLGAVEQ